MKHSQGLLPCPPFYSLNGEYGSQGSKELPFVLLSPLGLCLLDFQKELWESLVGGGADVADRAFGDTDVGEKGPQAGCVPWFDKA